MDSGQNKENIYCIFNQTQENSNMQIEKAFKIYLKELLKTKDNDLAKYTEKH